MKPIYIIYQQSSRKQSQQINIHQLSKAIIIFAPFVQENTQRSTLNNQFTFLSFHTSISSSHFFTFAKPREQVVELLIVQLLRCFSAEQICNISWWCGLQQMRKKYSKQKQIKIIKQRRCSMCMGSKDLGAHPRLIPLHNLRKKYYQPQIETYHYRATSNLLYDSSSRQSIQLIQAQKLSSAGSNISRYFTFSQTVQVIMPAVMFRVQKDYYGWVDFTTQHYMITNNYYIRRKHLIQNNKKMQKYLKSTYSMQSTGSDDDRAVREYIQNKIKNELDQNRIIKPMDNNSALQMHKLTKHIELMVGKIADLSVIRPYQSQYKVNKNKKGTANISLLFKQNICGEISAIDKAEECVKDCIGPGNYQQSYGLDTLKPKASQKGKKLNKLSLRSMDKLNGFDEKLFPETPKPRLFNPDSAYEEIQYTPNWGVARPNRKQQRSPASPHNHSSSLKNSKTLTKNSSHSRKK